MLELPEPRDAFDEKLIADLREYGWHCVLVADEHHPEHAEQNAARRRHAAYDASFAYSVGLSLTRGHPELILVGRWRQAHAIISSAVALVDAGARFRADDRTDQVLEGYDACFREVSPDSRIELLTAASWANSGRRFAALQLVLPDAGGVWPWQPDYSACPQPLLDGRVTAAGWVFGESPDTGVFTTRQVMHEGRPLGLISHDLEGDWQFLHDEDDGSETRDSDDLLIVHLRHIVARFPEVDQFADLPVGWIASLEGDGTTWIREPRPPEWDEREGDGD